MSNLFYVFVPAIDVDENVLSYTEVIDWGFKQCQSTEKNEDNILILNYDDIFNMQNFSEIFQVMNNAGNILIGMYETDAIFSNETKSNVFEALKTYLVSLKDSRLRFVVERIMHLLTIAIKLNKGIYFRF